MANFKKTSPGCSCCNTPCATGGICVTVKGCSSKVIQGAGVDIKTLGGTLLGSCVTGATGQCCFGGTMSPGTYTVVVTYATMTTVTTSATIPSDCSTPNVNVTMTPNATSVCHCCGEAIANALTLTFKGTSIALNWDATNALWVGCQPFASGTNHVNVSGYTFANPCTCTSCVLGTGTSAIQFRLSLGGSPCVWSLTAYIQCCTCCPGFVVASCNTDPTSFGWSGAGITDTTGAAANCSGPVNLSLTLESSAGACGSLAGYFGDAIHGISSYAVTITE